MRAFIAIAVCEHQHAMSLSRRPIAACCCHYVAYCVVVQLKATCDARCSPSPRCECFAIVCFCAAYCVVEQLKVARDAMYSLSLATRACIAVAATRAYRCCPQREYIVLQRLALTGLWPAQCRHHCCLQAFLGWAMSSLLLRSCRQALAAAMSSSLLLSAGYSCCIACLLH